MSRIGKLIKSVPVFGRLAAKVHDSLFSPERFSTSGQYWEARYHSGGNSGSGSYRKLAQFKAEVLNNFVQMHQVADVIEFGCGDGNQLLLAKYNAYMGFDVSETTVRTCMQLFKHDPSKEFKLVRAYNGEVADLAISLDVIFHLVEDDIFAEYMTRLFGASKRYVVIYSSDIDETQTWHVRHRKFSTWITRNQPGWLLIDSIPNRYPWRSTEPESTSFSNFYMYERVN